MNAPVPWPADARFEYGAHVQRAAYPNGRQPAYRFPGKICGWYRTPSGNLGFAVSNDHEPACIQIFPQSGLERWRKPPAAEPERDGQFEAVEQMGDGVRIVGPDQSEKPIPFSGGDARQRCE